MTYSAVPATSFPLFVDTSAAPHTTPVWVSVGGLNSVAAAQTTKEFEVTDYDNPSQQVMLVISHGQTVNCTGFVKYDASFALDPGQLACNTLSQAIGAANVGHFKVGTPGTTSYTFTASVKTPTLFGGTNAEAAKWALDLTCVTAPVLA